MSDSKLFIIFFLFGEVFFYRVCALARKTERDIETESEKSPPAGMVMLQSLLLHSPLGILGTHAHAPGVSFKPPGPGLELQSTTWESSDIAITLSAGPGIQCLNHHATCLLAP